MKREGFEIVVSEETVLFGGGRLKQSGLETQPRQRTTQGHAHGSGRPVSLVA